MALLFAMLLNVPPALDSSERPLNAVRKLVYTATKSALSQAQASDCVPVRLDQAALLILLREYTAILADAAYVSMMTCAALARVAGIGGQRIEDRNPIRETYLERLFWLA